MDDDRLKLLEQICSGLDSRLARIEALLGVAEKPRKETPLQAPVAPTRSDSPAVSRPTELWNMSPGAAERTSTGGNGTLLAAAGILCFVLAATFFIKLAIDSGWLTPLRQLVGASLFGGILIAAGIQLKGRDSAYSAFLPAAGIIILYMTAFAGHLYFELYGELFATGFAAILSLYSLYLFSYFKHEFFLIAAVCGSYCVPLLIGGYRSDPLSTLPYFAFWDCLFSLCAIWLGRRLLIGLAAYLAIGVWHVLVEVNRSTIGNELDPILFQFVQFLVFSGAVAAFSTFKRVALTGLEAWAFLPVLLLFYGIEFSMISRYSPDAAPWASLGFAAILFGLYQLARAQLENQRLESTPMLATFMALTLFHALYLELLPTWVAPWFGIALVIPLILLPRNGLPYDRFWPMYFVIAAAIGCEYFRVLTDGMSESTDHFVVFNALFFALVFVAYLLYQRAASASWTLLLLACLQAMRGLQRIADQTSSGDTERFVTSGLWGFFALVMLLWGQSSKNADVGRAGVFIFGIVALKVLFHDISSSGSVARVVALVVIGALLYSGGLIWRRIGAWENRG